MARQFFDNLDLKILHSLTANARTPYLEIAREYGVSGAAVHQRVQRLMQNHVIIGSECRIDPSTVGYDTCAYVGIFLRDPSQFNDVVDALEKIPEVVECHFTTGQYDIFIKIRLKYIFLTNDGVFCRTGLHAAPGLYGGVLLFFNC